MDQAEQDRALQSALEALPEDAREVLVLYYREGQSVAEVARGLGIPEVTVRKRLSRAREKLRAETEERLAFLLVVTAPSRALAPQIVRALSSRRWPVGLVLVGAVPLVALTVGLAADPEPPAAPEPSAQVRAAPASSSRPSSAPLMPAPVALLAPAEILWMDLDPFTRTSVAQLLATVSNAMSVGCGQPWAQHEGRLVQAHLRVWLDVGGLSRYELAEGSSMPPDVLRCVDEVMAAAPWPAMDRPGELLRVLSLVQSVPSESVTPEQARASLDEALEGIYAGHDALHRHRAELDGAEGVVVLQVDGPESSLTGLTEADLPEDLAAEVAATLEALASP
jgi:DNA-binding CsgD family transcriptional regulator